jgi:hypothetical protein
MCDDCVDAHRLEGTVEIIAGPSDIRSVHDVFADKALPVAIKSIVEKPTFCKTSRRLISQQNLSRIYLVPNS